MLHLEGDLPMKKLLSILLSVLLPNIFVQLWWENLYRWPNVSIISAGIFLYIITIISLVLFYRFRPCSMWILPFGFALPVPICYVRDTLNDSEWFTYVHTALTTVYYSIPFIIISVTVAMIYTIRKYKLKRSCNIKRNGWQRFLSGKLTLQEVKEAVIRKKPQIFSTGIAVIVLLIIAVIYTQDIYRKHIVRRDIIQTIDILTEQETECVFKLSEITKFKWDKVAYFKYPVTELQVSDALGVTYRKSTDVSEGFVFVYKGRVVHTDVVSISPGSGDRARLVVEAGPLTVWRENAVFKGRKIYDNLYSIE